MTRNRSYVPPNPSTSSLPLLTELTEAYKLWHIAFTQAPKFLRFTLAARIDAMLLLLIEQTLDARYYTRDQKGKTLHAISKALDALKLLLTLLWEMKGIDTKTYAQLSANIEQSTNTGEVQNAC